MASLGLVHGDRRWILDCTPDFPAQLVDLGGPPLSGILLTHAHMGHYTGLLQLGPEAWGAQSVPVHVMPGMRRFLIRNEPWASLVRARHVILHDLHAGRAATLTEQLTVTPWLVPHRGPWTETVAFLARGPSRSVLFMPDVDRWEDWERDLADVLSEVDVAYVDASFFDVDELPWRNPAEILHPFVRHTMDLLQPLPSALRTKVRFLHINHTNPLLDPTSPAWQEVHQRGFHVAVEGEEVEL